jgi:alkylhydroperoxidase family enzyme
MAWIETVPFADADESLRRALEAQQALYPKEYARAPQDDGRESIVASHTLIPEALHHAFATFGVLLSPSLPLSRAQHEMIATRVSALNRCHY